jgi:hypothetical protein
MLAWLGGALPLLGSWAAECHLGGVVAAKSSREFA